ncbi:MAG: methyltransferase [Ferruginibacter sp.]
MANNYFQFKQFTVQQDQCSMKVCTDACIFGAYIARHLMSTNQAVKTILDIGTGTGLLSLLLAQKLTDANITALEIDDAAVLQALKNFDQSPWSNRLQVSNTDVMQFSSTFKYDCIISNPPFFEADLKSPDKNKNAAKHDTTLTLEQLLQFANTNLSADGIFAVLLPFHRIDYFIKLAAKQHFYLTEKLLVKHTVAHPYFRGILLFTRIPASIIESELVIKNKEGGYSESFIDLLNEYYLYL